MAVIAENTPLTADVFRLTVAVVPSVAAVPGQFCMLKIGGAFLPRPISIHDVSDAGDTVTFLIHARGEGTRSMARVFRPGCVAEVSGPLGNGLAPQNAPLTLVGGGVGTAPLYYLAKRWRQAFPEQPVRAFLGFADEPFALDVWGTVGIAPTVNVGGFVTDDADFTQGGAVFVCGPDAMMRAAYRKARDSGAEMRSFYVSLEGRMACGLGACLGCSHPTRDGNKRVCKDGPVFLGEDVYEG